MRRGLWSASVPVPVSLAMAEADCWSRKDGLTAREGLVMVREGSMMVRQKAWERANLTEARAV
jgi:hypothetical protein